MTTTYNLSPALSDLITYVEGEIGTELLLHRQPDAPPQGMLIDDYTYHTGKNVIVFPASQLGMLKDFVIARHCIMLLLKAHASRYDELSMLSICEPGALAGTKQIYLDTLKDENTRNMELWRKKQLIFELYMLFHETLSDLPWNIVSHIVVARKYPVMRNAQVYFLLKESMREMHDLVPVKDYLPQRYFVLHNGMYYARDMLLAFVLSEFKLNPVINIPELQKFRNLDVKEMMTHRWSRSIWYHTKIFGDAMSNILKLTINIDFNREMDPLYFRDIYRCGTEIANRWLFMMSMQDWYCWDSPERVREALGDRARLERAARLEIFGGD